MENTEICSYKNIIKISNQGIDYINTNKERCFIDFIECNRYWIEHVNTSGQFSSGTGLEAGQSTCVGCRDICSNPPYVELFSNPKVRFIFPYEEILFDKFMERMFSKKHRKFHEIQQRIISSGWSMYDMS